MAASSLPRQTVYIDPARRSFSTKWIIGIVLLHIGLLTFLVMNDTLPLPAPLNTLMVQMIAPTPPAPETTPRPQPVERKPLPRAQPVAQQPQRLAARSEAPSAAVEAPAVKEAPPAAAAPAAPAASPAISQPRFDADYLLNPAPIYPALARRMGEEGRVILRVFVEAAGRPGQIEVKSSSGSPRLDQAAQDAVWRWKFVAARRGFDPIGAWVLVPIVFNLKG